MSLELYTNEELIEEVLNRDLFVGFLIQSLHNAEEYSQHKQFDLKISKTLDMQQALTLLETCASELRKKGFLGVSDECS